jgi:hypothetical protein
MELTISQEAWYMFGGPMLFPIHGSFKFNDGAFSFIDDNGQQRFSFSNSSVKKVRYGLGWFIFTTSSGKYRFCFYYARIHTANLSVWNWRGTWGNPSYKKRIASEDVTQKLASALKKNSIPVRGSIYKTWHIFWHRAVWIIYFLIGLIILIAIALHFINPAE